MNRTQFMKAMAAHGATLDADAEAAGTLIADLPAGKRWAANGCHALVAPFENNGGQSWKSDAYADIAERMAYGAEDCDGVGCDICEGY